MNYKRAQLNRSARYKELYTVYGQKGVSIGHIRASSINDAISQARYHIHEAYAVALGGSVRDIGRVQTRVYTRNKKPI